MGRVMGANAWEALFDKGMVALDSLSPMLPAPNWTMGGGTVLMFRYHHRLSQDVDIFLTDAQYLTALSPRLSVESPDDTCCAMGWKMNVCEECVQKQLSGWSEMVTVCETFT